MSWDPEKGEKARSLDGINDFEAETSLVDNRSRWQKFVDSWKRAEEPNFDPTGLSEEQIYQKKLAQAPMQHKLKNHHIQMIAIGGCIGSGLFITSGSSLASGGPAGVLIGYGIIAIMLLCVMFSLGEVAVRFPVVGAFNTHAIRLLDPSWGFACGMLYVLLWIVTVPLELIAATLILEFWDSDNNGATNVNKAAWVALFYFQSAFIGLFGARAFGDAEFILSAIKVITIVGFCIFGIVITCGGGPNHHYYGAHYYHDPGPFYLTPPGTHNLVGAKVKGVVNVFVNSAFAFSGTELCALAAAETEKPQDVLPKAVKQTFWRVLLFYIVSLTICFCLVPSNQSGLGATSDGRSSPFVLAIVNSGVSGLPSVVNTVILLAALSVANSSVYATSRTISAMSNAGQLPKIFGYIDRSGRPLVALGVTLFIGLLCFVVASDQYNNVFNWLVALSGQTSLFIWGTICLNMIRLRWIMKAQGRSTDEQYFNSPVGIVGAWIGFIVNAGILGLQFWVAIFPQGESPDAETFFEIMLSVPICIVLFVGHKLWYRDPYVHAKDVDICTGARIRTPDEAEQFVPHADLKHYPVVLRFFIRVYRFWC